MAPPLREERVTWVDPDVMSAGATTSYGSFPAAQGSTSIGSSSRQQAERGPLLPSHHMEQEEEDVHHPHWPSATQQRRLRWRAIAVSVSSLLAVACLLLVVVARNSSGTGSPADAPSAGREVTAAVSGTGSEAPLPLPLPGESFLESEGEGSVFAALRLGFPGAAMAREGAASPAAVDPSPDYPSSAPQDPSIKIPVAMGCLEAMCESWMAAMGKAYADKQNMVLLDCIQRTGMSPNDTRGCFARSDVEGSPLRQGLYQCGVCRECMQAADAEEKKAICKDYQASASSASVGGGQKKVGGGTAPSASAWQQYVPKYMPGGGMLKTPTGWF